MSNSADLFLTQLANKNFEQAAKLFCTAPLSEQASLLEQLNTDAHKSNPATHTPKVLAVVQRNLKNDANIEEFYEAWQPDVTSQQVDDNHNQYHYFKLPVRVINARNVDDPNNIISISMIACNDYDEVFDEYSERQTEEQTRANKISNIADKTANNEMYEIISDDIIGYRPPE